MSAVIAVVEIDSELSASSHSRIRALELSTASRSHSRRKVSISAAACGRRQAGTVCKFRPRRAQAAAATARLPAESLPVSCTTGIVRPTFDRDHNAAISSALAASEGASWEGSLAGLTTPSRRSSRHCTPAR